MRSKTRLSWLRPRFTLAALLVLITVVAIPLSYVAQRRAWNLRRKAAYERLAAKDFEIIGIAWETDIVEDAGDDPFGVPIAGEDDPFGVAEEPAGWSREGWWNDLCLNSASPGVTHFWSLGEGDAVTAADLADLALFPEIEGIQLKLTASIQDEQLRWLGELPALRELAIGNGDAITGEFFQYLKDTPTIEKLELVALPNLDGKLFPRLDQWKRFESLVIDDCPKLTDESMRHVDLQPPMHRLEIRSAALGDETIGRWLLQVRPWELEICASVSRKIAPALARQHYLARLSLFDAPLVDEDFAFLAHCEQLRHLRLEVMPIRGDFLAKLPAPLEMKEISFDSTLFDDRNLEAIGRFKNLDRLILDWTPLNGESFEGCQQWPKMYELSLMGAWFTPRGKAALAKISGPSNVDLPANWEREDFQLFANGKPHYATMPPAGEAPVVGGPYPWNGPLWNSKPRNCSEEEMAPVLELYRRVKERLVAEGAKFEE